MYAFFSPDCMAPFPRHSFMNRKVKLGTRSTRDAKTKTDRCNSSTNSKKEINLLETKTSCSPDFINPLTILPILFQLAIVANCFPLPRPLLTCHHQAYPTTIPGRYHHFIYLRRSHCFVAVTHHRRSTLRLLLPDPVRSFVDTHELEPDRVSHKGYG